MLPAKTKKSDKNELTPNKPRRGFWRWLCRKRPNPTDTPVPTSTELPELPSTPLVPTSTPLPASTPLVPTSTPLPASTPLVPTSTPLVPTSTSLVPTSTPLVPTSAPLVPTEVPLAPTSTPRLAPVAPAHLCRPGCPRVLGATATDAGINFALFSHHATAVYLELFGAPNDKKSQHSFQLHPRKNRTGDIWHIEVNGLRPGQLYGFRVDGPYTPDAGGHRFNVNKLLTDPYGHSFVGAYRFDNDLVFGYDRHSERADMSFSTEDSAAVVPKAVALGRDDFDWEDDQLPGVPATETVIYEMHVRGFTAHPSSASVAPGTYAGVLDRIDHLKRLGVTSVELLPIHSFNPADSSGIDPETGTALTNYWGYATLAFNALHAPYASVSDPKDALREFKTMVKVLHAAGIEVILDVVYNHTGEGDERGPTIGFRGFDNAVYYMLCKGGRHYHNYSGCGNTVNCNHPAVKHLIIDSLRYWALEMHIDGFRFDLATILGRSNRGAWLGDYSLLRDIAEDPVLRRRKLIAEPWDAGGLVLTGQLPGRFAEWNNRFRDDVRSFVRGDHGKVVDLARRIGGSADLFGEKTSATATVNFVTAHDGFTLRDLVSYREKHNERNGEENRDGCSNNISYNCGVEGDTTDAETASLRLRLAKNLITVLMVSRGTPMLLSGDELWRTQRGNNNAYCQDNDLSWLSWSSNDISTEMRRFVSRITHVRRTLSALKGDDLAAPPTDKSSKQNPRIQWHGVHPGQPDWTFHSRTLAVVLRGDPHAYDKISRADVYAAFNGWTEPLTFLLPPPANGTCWHLLIDTSLRPPHDITDVPQSHPIDSDSYKLSERTSVILIAMPKYSSP